MTKLLVMILIAPITLLALGGCSKNVGTPPSDPRIIGYWTMVGGDYPLTNEYRADGMFIQHSGAQSGDASPFRIEGDQIIITITQPDGKPSIFKIRFQLEGDTLTLFDSDTEKRIFRRNGRG